MAHVDVNLYTTPRLGTALQQLRELCPETLITEYLMRVDQNPAMLNEPEVENNLTHELSKHLARHMPRAAEMSEEIQEMSIDSLMAVEI
ncbi:hypothetical protein BO85DRAFT_519583 [Aspergillus piperis CBS 112811]|uniref:Uncharacterized protein n=1 Tax=Aspergillus piperis CBS 112811 TaxID=1448313 RepID=A0A8G1VQG7_9EURO|nr:hypothetical protein BO85DRAFT_519583 [Aspergillus piperis CBS 112811]RAH58748.1 hypothetical protein BO85DRAFT_519583 [Aspergillus piperis CBS 112811]